jgi:hypothetical protein
MAEEDQDAANQLECQEDPSVRDPAHFGGIMLAIFQRPWRCETGRRRWLG